MKKIFLLFFFTSLFSPVFAADISSDSAKNDSAQCVAYPIKFSRKDRVGDQFRIDATSERLVLNTVSRPKKPQKENNIKLTTSFAANITVLAVNAKGSATRVDIKIIQMKVVDPTVPNPMEILESGSHFEASVGNGKTVFRAGGKQLTKVQSEELELFIPLDTGNVSDNDVFGSTIPRKVGEEWDADSVRAAELLKDIGRVNPQAVKAKTKLVSIIGKDDLAYFHARTSLSVNKVELPQMSELNVDQCRIFFSSEIRAPVTENPKARYSVLATMRISIDYKIPQEDGSWVSASQMTEMRQRSVVTPK